MFRRMDVGSPRIGYMGKGEGGWMDHGSSLAHERPRLQTLHHRIRSPTLWGIFTKNGSNQSNNLDEVNFPMYEIKPTTIIKHEHLP